MKDVVDTEGKASNHDLTSASVFQRIQLGLPPDRLEGRVYGADEGAAKTRSSSLIPTMSLRNLSLGFGTEDQ
jgi:hypothetical protein